MRRWAVLLLLLALPACGKKSEAQFQDQAVKVARTVPSPKDAAAPGAPASSAPAAAPLLAYSYDDTLSLPAERIPAVLAHHQQLCANAGPTVCQLVGSNLSRQGRDVAQASLELRATPTFIAQFRGGLDSEAQAAGGRVESANVQTEDLSRSIVDTEAEIRAKTTLRDRLERLLADRPGKLSDVLDAEKELARVQGELDASQSELAVMRTRVETSKLTLTYQAMGVAAPDGITRPLLWAANSFLRNMMIVFAGLLTLASYVLPLVLVIGPLVWWAIRRDRRAKASRRDPPPQTPGD
ncbi:MAG: DUF4349 domain-containing protein [Caulobacteraceae bacterium]|nr:DUF4349 domain-containing protein [Caulobacteraceae bacterium]